MNFFVCVGLHNLIHNSFSNKKEAKGNQINFSADKDFHWPFLFKLEGGSQKTSLNWAVWKKVSKIEWDDWKKKQSISELEKVGVWERDERQQKYIVVARAVF